MSINVHKSELSYPFSYASNISYLQPINTIPKFISNHFLSSILTYIFHHKISDGPLRKNHFRGHCHSYVPIVLSLLGRPVLLTFGLEHRIGCMKIQESHPHHQQRLTRRPSHETGIGTAQSLSWLCLTQTEICTHTNNSKSYKQIFTRNESGL